MTLPLGTGIHIGHKGKYFILMKIKCIINYKSASNRLFSGKEKIKEKTTINTLKRYFSLYLFDR